MNFRKFALNLFQTKLNWTDTSEIFAFFACRTILIINLEISRSLLAFSVVYCSNFNVLNVENWIFLNLRNNNDFHLIISWPFLTYFRFFSVNCPFLCGFSKTFIQIFSNQFKIFDFVHVFKNINEQVNVSIINFIFMIENFVFGFFYFWLLNKSQKNFFFFEWKQLFSSDGKRLKRFHEKFEKIWRSRRCRLSRFRSCSRQRGNFS